MSEPVINAQKSEPNLEKSEHASSEGPDEEAEVEERGRTQLSYANADQSPGLDNLFRKFDEEVIKDPSQKQSPKPSEPIEEGSSEGKSHQQKIEDLEKQMAELEKHWEIQDKWQLVSWGLRQK